MARNTTWIYKILTIYSLTHVRDYVCILYSVLTNKRTSSFRADRRTWQTTIAIYVITGLSKNTGKRGSSRISIVILSITNSSIWSGITYVRVRIIAAHILIHSWPSTCLAIRMASISLHWISRNAVKILKRARSWSWFRRCSRYRICTSKTPIYGRVWARSSGCVA